MVRESKISSRSGKSQGISLRVRKHLRLTEGKKILRVHLYIYRHESCCIGRIFFMKFEHADVEF